MRFRLPGCRFAYGLANGTIGVYDGAVRLWRVKSKHEVVAVAGYDFDQDGQLELVSGWSNGKVRGGRRQGTPACRHCNLGPRTANRCNSPMPVISGISF
jgi:hypothetical protein